MFIKQTWRRNAAAMKKYMLFLVLLIFGLASLAQNKFTQANLKEMLQEYKIDPNAFFIKP